MRRLFLQTNSVSGKDRKGMRWPLTLRLLDALLLLSVLASTSAAARTFEIRGNNFYKDGQPFTIVSGSMHYWRIVPEYWADRLQKVHIFHFLSQHLILIPALGSSVWSQLKYDTSVKKDFNY